MFPAGTSGNYLQKPYDLWRITLSTVVVFLPSTLASFLLSVSSSSCFPALCFSSSSSFSSSTLSSSLHPIAAPSPPAFTPSPPLFAPPPNPSTLHSLHHFRASLLPLNPTSSQNSFRRKVHDEIFVVILQCPNGSLTSLGSHPQN